MKFIFSLFSVVIVSAVLPFIEGQRGPFMPLPPFQEEDCYLEPQGICPYSAAPEKEAINVWKWDVSANKCVEVLYYTNCQRTRNNFDDFESCSRIAGPICRFFVS
ncbi:unnamed protein product [Diabrotica balteata]|uniref:BPTI/Kunitz inhibitor domain-containing protein n=1 Tax=Diabrotica balteata TaxID=107213 RepID=A0A9N9T7H2_DIABA|nr:unnamed protein product [Diabrotica balteata]